jgi:hypothetical protein
MSTMANDDVWNKMYWRVGRKVGRTIYAMPNGKHGASDDDILIGMMDSLEIALEACISHNIAISSKLEEKTEPEK